MNERIRELAEQAGIPAIDGKWDYNDRNLLVKEDGEWRVAQLSEIISTMIQSERGLNKFAQLIVRECIYEVEGLQVLQSTLDRSQHWNRAIAHTALHLKEHFGVKE